MKYLKNKCFEEGTMDDHDNYSSQVFIDSLKIDLKKLKYCKSRNLI
jgi:hypothetical protein